MPGSRLFTLSEPNYFLFAWQGSGETPFANDRYLEQIKFRVALRYRAISLGEHEFDSGVYVAYRQNSFWHLWEDSAPFFDNNYNPYVFFFWDSRDVRGYKIPSIRLFVEHESNGRDGPDSRSWNRIGGGFDFGDYESSWIFANTRIWNAFSVGRENRDLEEYAGIGEVTVSVQPLVTKGYLLGSAGASARMRFDRDLDPRNIEANVFLGSKTFGANSWFGRGLSRINASVVVQYFNGRAENLLSYQESHKVFRIGLATVR